MPNIREIIHDYWELELPSVYPRQAQLNLDTPLINDIVGPRRAGKTYLMLGAIRRLLEKTDKRATIYINFENRRLMPLSGDCFNEIVAVLYSERLLEKYRVVYVFLDEVQRIDGWERFVRSIYDEFKGKIRIVVSGSSASLLSREYGKLLTGRHLTTGVFPLSFAEFLRFKGISLVSRSEKTVSIIKSAFDEYLAYGAFPEAVLTDNRKSKEDIVNQLFTDILSRDIAARAVRKEQVIEDFAYFLCSNAASLLSFRKMAQYFRSRGTKISVPTVENYFYHMRNAFLFFDNMLFSYSAKDQMQYPRKVYCIDSGIINLTGFRFSQNLGRVYENTAALELARRFFNKPRTRVFYWKDARGAEVDFVIKDALRVRQLIQVCLFRGSVEERERELKSLVSASEALKCAKLLVLTQGYEGNEKLKGKKIMFAPLWKWLAQGEDWERNGASA